jgi:hypothetical protein
MKNNYDNFDVIENYGRASAPTLPPELRARTLTRCVQVVNHKRRHRGWALIGTLAGVCVIHWLAISSLNAQNNLLMGGNNSNQTSARFAMTSSEHQIFQQQRAELFANSGIDYDALYTFENKAGE